MNGYLGPNRQGMGYRPSSHIIPFFFNDGVPYFGLFGLSEQYWPLATPQNQKFVKMRDKKRIEKCAIRFMGEKNKKNKRKRKSEKCAIRFMGEIR